MLRLTRRTFSNGRLKTVLRMEAQDRNWTVGDLRTHSGAFGHGLDCLAQAFSAPDQPLKGTPPADLRYKPA